MIKGWGSVFIVCQYMRFETHYQFAVCVEATSANYCSNISTRMEGSRKILPAGEKNQLSALATRASSTLRTLYLNKRCPGKSASRRRNQAGFYFTKPTSQKEMSGNNNNNNNIDVNINNFASTHRSGDKNNDDNLQSPKPGHHTENLVLGGMCLLRY
jgi:hypothetical protein